MRKRSIDYALFSKPEVSAFHLRLADTQFFFVYFQSTAGKWILPSQHTEEPYVLDSIVIEEARQHILQEKELYPICCPVRLLHGMKDGDVPYQVSLDLVNQLESDDVQLTLIKDGGHRLSDAHNLQLLTKTLGHLIDQVKQSD